MKGSRYSFIRRNSSMPFNIDLIYTPPRLPRSLPSLSLASISFPCYAILTRLTTASVVVHPLSLRFRCLMNYIEINLDYRRYNNFYLDIIRYFPKETIFHSRSVKFLLPFSYTYIFWFDRSIARWFFFQRSIIDSIWYTKAYKGV